MIDFVYLSHYAKVGFNPLLLTLFNKLPASWAGNEKVLIVVTGAFGSLQDDELLRDHSVPEFALDIDDEVLVSGFAAVGASSQS